MKSALITLAIVAGILVGAHALTAKAQVVWPTGPWWYTNHPEIVAVNGGTGAMTAVSAGIAIICVQPSVSVRNPAQCFTVIVSQVVK